MKLRIMVTTLSQEEPSVLYGYVKRTVDQSVVFDRRVHDPFES